MFGKHHRFKVCTGERYIGGYISYDKSKRNHLIDLTLTWENNIRTIRETAGKYPQESCAAVAHAIQSEWIFLQRVTWYTGDMFARVDKTIQENFLPRLFFGNKKSLSPIVGALIKVPFKRDGLVLLNLVTSEKEKYLSSQRGGAELIRP